MSRPTHIQIDLAAIKHNLQQVKTFAPTSKVIAMVKANAYGHGAAEVSLAIAEQVDMFGVCCLEEALQLREHGIQHSILLIEGCFEASEYKQAIMAGCECVIHSMLQVKELLNLSSVMKLKVWLKVDSGMHRLGLTPHEFIEAYQLLHTSEMIESIQLLSHFSSADDQDKTSALTQLTLLQSLIKTQIAQGHNMPVSLANSAALLTLEQSHYDWVRPGIMLYGISPFRSNMSCPADLQPVMSFTSKVIALRNIEIGESVGYGDAWTAKRRSLIATIAVGYGDGYPRTASSGTPVLVNGQRGELVGRVSMDMICVDVTDLLSVNINDPVELWGKNLAVNEVAEHAGTLGYELVTRMTGRVRRSFIPV